MEFKKHDRRTQGKGRKTKIKTEKEANHERLLSTENKVGVAGGEVGGEGLDGGWALRRALVGMSIGCCREVMKSLGSTPETKTILLTSLSLNTLYKQIERKEPVSLLSQG